MDDYGKELILDLHHCASITFTRLSIRRYFKKLCRMIEMERGELYWWDDLHTPEAEKEVMPHLKGTSAVQFIKTSNITIHTLDILQKVFINIFSCKDFDEERVVEFTSDWFEGEIASLTTIRRL